ncbi:MAG TPA: SGNH/GDSL hydrolase family protein [Saprospiraceae bacterium]|nr:SGNH/GDSL hydrolase family protein [Saprospiraceae bacterium]
MWLKCRPFFATLLLLFTWACQEETTVEMTPEEDGELHSILFIGNSHTDYNGGVDQQLEQLISGADSLTVGDIQREAPGGYTLMDHYLSPATQNLLGSKKWDLVVLQENTYEAYTHPQELAGSVEKFFFELFQKGTMLSFFMTWPYRDSLQMYPVLKEAYQHPSVTYYGQTIPIGIAWYEARTNQKPYDLYNEDGIHPSPAGTFFTACLFYAFLFERNPARSRYMGQEINPDLANQLKSDAWVFYLGHH